MQISLLERLKQQRQILVLIVEDLEFQQQSHKLTDDEVRAVFALKRHVTDTVSHLTAAISGLEEGALK